MPMFPSVSLLHAQVREKMRAKELRANVGAVFFATTTEAIERGRPTNAGIQSLAKDINNQLVYMDPELLHKRLADLEANEKKYEGSGYTPGADYLAIKKQLVDASATLDARAKTLPPDKVKAEYTYSDSFFAFKGQWDAYYTRVQNGELTSGELAGNEVFKTIDDFDNQYRQYWQKFKDLGYVPSIEPPKKSNVGDVLPDVNIKASLDAIPWTQIGLFVGGAVALYWFINRRPSEPAPPALPERRIGPPEPHPHEDPLARAHL